MSLISFCLFSLFLRSHPVAGPVEPLDFGQPLPSCYFPPHSLFCVKDTHKKLSFWFSQGVCGDSPGLDELLEFKRMFHKNLAGNYSEHSLQGSYKCIISLCGEHQSEGFFPQYCVYMSVMIPQFRCRL